MPKYTKTTDLVKKQAEENRAKSGRFQSKVSDPHWSMAKTLNIQPAKYKGDGTPLSHYQPGTIARYMSDTDWMAWTGVAALIAGLLALGCIGLAYENYTCHAKPAKAPLPTVRSSNESAY